MADGKFRRRISLRGCSYSILISLRFLAIFAWADVARRRRRLRTPLVYARFKYALDDFDDDLMADDWPAPRNGKPN